MAFALLPAGAAAALSSPRWSAAASTKGHPNQVGCMNHLHQLHLKLPLAAESHKSRSLVGCCITSRLSAEAATSSRSAHASSSGKDVSMRDSVGIVSGAPIVISGYWIGPDMDDGCGHIQAILQRIS